MTFNNSVNNLKNKNEKNENMKYTLCIKKILSYIVLLFVCATISLPLTACESSSPKSEISKENDKKDKKKDKDKDKDKDKKDKDKKDKDKKDKDKKDKKDKDNGNSGSTGNNGKRTIWFEEQGLEFTTSRTFVVPTTSYNSSGYIEIPADALIVENYDDCEDGYKNIVTTINLYDNGTSDFWISYFDAYTGQSFEFVSTFTRAGEGQTCETSGEAAFNVYGEDITVPVKMVNSLNNGVTNIEITFTVPKTYDGLVIQLGENNPLIYGEDYFTYGDDIVYADQLTNMHGGYVYLCIMANK